MSWAHVSISFSCGENNPHSQWLTSVYFFLRGLHLSWAKLDSTGAFICKLRLKNHLLSRCSIATEENSEGSTIRWWILQPVLRLSIPFFFTHSVGQCHSHGPDQSQEHGNAQFLYSPGTLPSNIAKGKEASTVNK